MIDLSGIRVLRPLNTRCIEWASADLSSFQVLDAEDLRPPSHWWIGIYYQKTWSSPAYPGLFTPFWVPASSAQWINWSWSCPLHIKSVEVLSLPLVGSGTSERLIPTQMLSSSLDCGSKFQGSLPIALV
ncbi:hypothetical protein TNCV_4501831 [Trichonephila clavipes]|nr:hypothetical protein TNCV_4501831 [Trichonephila clavipes]